jgi:2-oxoisovalerate dehydrogenase E1 component
VGTAVAEPIDDFFLSRVRGLAAAPAPTARTTLDPEVALALFEAQLQSRHLDLAARWLQSVGQGYYTISSAGHEANAAVGMVTRVDDPALLHYRSGGFYAARAARLSAERPASTVHPVRDVLLSLVSSTADPMSGGRHKVFGHPELHIVPQTSTISSHLPRAVGLAFAIGNLHDLAPALPWPADAIVVCSLGDASVNHSTAQGALNAAAYLTHRDVPTPVLFVCEDNGIGISTRSPSGWPARTLQRMPGVSYFPADSAEPDLLIGAVEQAVQSVRTSRRPAVLHLRTVRFMGHAGSDAEIGYRSRAEIVADYERDPLLASAGFLVRHGHLTAADVLERYELMRSVVMGEAKAACEEPRLGSRHAVMRPLSQPTRRRAEPAGVDARFEAWAGTPPETQGRLSLAQAINAALNDVLAIRPHALVFGEDVAVKGGVYGLTRGLRKRFGGRRVFDTLLDEQTILGTALGTSLAGLLPIPEIQYLAYLHNAEDQLRGEAATLQFFSDSQYRNPMVVRIAGLGYQKGFGGHFHNDNSVAVLRDVPGLVLCTPSHPQDAPGLLRACVDLAETEGRVCVYLEPIALYHARDLHEQGDDAWTATYDARLQPDPDHYGLGTVRSYGEGADVLVVTFGNGLPMSLRAVRRPEADGIGTTVLDLRWLSPLPTEALLRHASRFNRVLVVDETRRSGGVSEGVVAALVDGGYRGALARVASADTFVPLGPATEHVLLSEAEIAQSIHDLSTIKLLRR